MSRTHHVVVDGSNLATEGRTVPSLAQLDEAVKAYLAEDPEADIVVVVDASFSHRIDPAERAQLEAAELHGELVAPPAGAIGRGDAFVLRIAERTGATVLSNDSFQEFHDEHAWLFDDGRLVGGKPVPGVGWIFTPRRPVRGPKSRKVKDPETQNEEDLSAPRKAAEVAKALQKEAKARTASHRKVAVKAAEPKAAKKRTAVAATPSPTAAHTLKMAAQAPKTAKATKVAEPKTQTARAKSTRSSSTKPAASKDSPEEVSHVSVKKSRASGPTDAASPVKKAKKANKADKALKADKADKALKVRPSEIQKAIDRATKEVLRAPEPLSGDGSVAQRRRRGAPPPAVNPPLAFIHFVAAYPLGATVEGVVASFTSHGAMAEVPLPEGGTLHCYVPLTGLGSPPPRAAREVLTRGEHHQFVLVALDPPRRMAELVLPELATRFLDAKASRSTSLS